MTVGSLGGDPFGASTTILHFAGITILLWSVTIPSSIGNLSILWAMDGTAWTFLRPGRPMMLLYDDGDLTTMKFIRALVKCSLSPRDTISDICPNSQDISSLNPKSRSSIYIHAVDKMPLHLNFDYNWVFLSAAACEGWERDFVARRETMGGPLPGYSLSWLDHEDHCLLFLSHDSDSESWVCKFRCELSPFLKVYPRGGEILGRCCVGSHGWRQLVSTKWCIRFKGKQCTYNGFQSGYLFQVKVFDLLLRKETPLALPREGVLRLDSSVRASVIVCHGWPSVVEWHVVVRGLCSLRNCAAYAPCDRVRIMLFAERLALGHF
ncbi:hypothetical protein Tco_0108796 [Tanacetum coccineum]